MKKSHFWNRLVYANLVINFAYIFMEWLFIATKPSFMSGFTFYEKLIVLFVVGSVQVVLSNFILLPLMLVDFFAFSRSKSRLLIFVGCVYPTFLAAATILLLFDNFTYTMFKWGIITSTGLVRLVYLLGFLVIGYFLFKKLSSLVCKVQAKTVQQKRKRLWLTNSILVACIILVIFSLEIKDYEKINIPTEDGGNSSQKYPNILYITSDGVNASNMSVYGYARDTTPHITELAQKSVVAENAFTNSGNTCGSITSVFTGKLPSTTRMIYPPDILQNEDAYQHLPGILKNIGYTAVELGVPNYVDAYSYNLINGFDAVNGRNIVQDSSKSIFEKYLPTKYTYFFYEIQTRLTDRLKHIFFMKTMENPYLMVTQKPDTYSDKDKLDQALTLLQTVPRPFYIHVHFMGTHGTIFSPSEQVFSKGIKLKNQDPWDIDVYDDSILDFDRYIGSIVQSLTDLDMIDNTILVINSDHGMNWNALEKIPLIIHFPNDEYAFRTSKTIENIDIAPTILDYLNLQTPGWMAGQSILSDALPEIRPIFSFSVFGAEMNSAGFYGVNYTNLTPPFYQFGRINMVYCQKWYTLDLVNTRWTTGEVGNYVNPCGAENILSDEQALALMVKQLSADQFDIQMLFDKVK